MNKPEEFCFLFIDGWATCMSKTEWAGWAQVLVTLGTLGFGALAVWWEAHQRRRETLAAAAENLLARLAVLRLLAGQWEAFLNVHRSDLAQFEKEYPVNLEMFNMAVMESKDVELREMPTEKCVRALVQVRALVKGAEKILAISRGDRFNESELYRMQVGFEGVMKHIQVIHMESMRLQAGGK